MYLNAIRLAAAGFFLMSGTSLLAAGERRASLNLGLNVSRQWNTSTTKYDDEGRSSPESSETRNDLSAGLIYLHLGKHVHYGPSAFYYRSYGRGSYEQTSFNVGGAVKVTLEDLKVATSTPFMMVQGSVESSKLTFSDTSKGLDKILEASIGYEFFLNNYVSIQNYVSWSRTWGEKKTEREAFIDNSKYEETESSVSSKVDLNIGFGIYL